MFQSTRPHGARLGVLMGGIDPKCFNPRARMGRDRQAKAEAEGAKRFNPRARMGRDCACWSA